VNVAQFREHVTTSLGDEAVQRLLDASSEAIVSALGPYLTDGTIDEIITPRGLGPLLRLSRRAESIDEIIEGTTTLAADDYELRSSGYIVRRLDTGTNPASYWRNRVYVTYLPLSDLAERDRVQLELVKLDLAYQPGITQETIGSWSETLAQGDRTYQVERAAILASLNQQSVGIW
jgi:hypothetical protein